MSVQARPIDIRNEYQSALVQAYEVVNSDGIYDYICYRIWGTRRISGLDLDK